ncbi:MAG: hypothetical protein O9333_01015 [Beijerinckiaceae bacterium]|jgi:hypothetical protein|nr:hypothetical protein [Beijerinckiaceae bacterium]
MSVKPTDPEQKARLAEALRANLQRRKQQARQRPASGAAQPSAAAEKPPQSPGTPDASR